MTATWLEERLADAAAHMDFPSTPDIAGKVAARLTTTAAPPAFTRRWRAAALAAGLAVVLVAAVVIAVPAGREAVADLLGVGSARVEVVPELPPVGAGLRLGEPVTVAGASDALGAAVLFPEQLGEPEAIYADPAGRVTLVYAARPGLPEADLPGVGLLLERVPQDAGVFWKQATIDTGFVSTRVNGDFAIWLEGGPHAVFYLGPDGEPTPRDGRLAGNTLLWFDETTTYRLEAAIPLEQAVEIAESIGR